MENEKLEGGSWVAKKAYLEDDDGRSLAEKVPDGNGGGHGGRRGAKERAANVATRGTSGRQFAKKKTYARKI